MSWLDRITRHPVVSTVLAAALIATAGFVWTRVVGEDSPPDPGPPVLADLDLDVVRDPDQVGMGPGEPYFYWLPEDVRDLEDPPTDCRERDDWAYGNGGADADYVWAKLTLENSRSTEVSVDDFRLEVEDDVPTPGGTVAACPVGGASAEPYGLLVDFSVDPPSLLFREEQGAEPTAVPRFELQPGEQDAFVINVIGRPGRLVSWRLVADVRSEGRTVPLALPDGEEPLLIAGTGELPMFTWDGSAWEPWS